MMVGFLSFCLAFGNVINQYYLLIELFYLYYCIEDVIVCSFDQPCSWNGIETWKKSSHVADNFSVFEGKFTLT